MLVLASRSPRRSELLRAAGFEFTIRTADVDESIEPRESPEGYVQRLAEKKARAVAIQPGENQFHCRIPVLPLCPGNYAIRGGVTDLNTSMALALLGFQDSPAFFSVKGAQVDKISNWHAMLNDLVLVPVEWSG